MTRVDEWGMASFADRELAPLLGRFDGNASVQELRAFFEDLQCALATCADRIRREAAEEIIAAMRNDLDAAAAATPIQELIDAMAFLVRREILAHPERALELLMSWPVPSTINGRLIAGWPPEHGAELTLTVQGLLAEIDSALLKASVSSEESA